MYGDENFMLVLSVGGQASFYSDWLKEDRGEHVGPARLAGLGRP